MTLTTRRPVAQALVNGTPVNYPLDHAATMGLDQEVATYQVTIPFPIQSGLDRGSRVSFIAGDPVGGAVRERFTGYIIGHGSMLWPGTWTIPCEDVLTVAKSVMGNLSTLHNLTDEEAMTIVLQSCGYPLSALDIQGTGKIIGQVTSNNLIWQPNQSAMDIIRQIDGISVVGTAAYRTRAMPGGTIVRRLVATKPTENYVHNFEEGVDILEGSMTTEFIDASNEVMIQGDGVSSTVNDGGENTFLFSQSPYFRRYLMLQNELAASGLLNTEDVATFLLAHLNRNLIRVTFTTHLDTYFTAFESVKVTAPRFGVDQVFWVQNVQFTVAENGELAQNLSCVSELAPNFGSNAGALILNRNPFTGATRPVPTIPATAPSNADVLADFVVLGIVKEKVLIASVSTDLYVVTCADTSSSAQGTITTRAWTASGGSPQVTSGDGLTFTTGFLSLIGATVSLTVTDSNGSTGTRTRDISSTGLPIWLRKLYAATATHAWAFDGTDWRADAPSDAGTMTAMAPGPMWAAGDIAMRSDDDLATDAPESTPFGATGTSALWMEPDVSDSAAAAGATDGRIALSSDAGATWTVKDGPDSNEVRRIIISRFNTGELHVITEDGYYVSDNYGDGWRTVRLGNFQDLQLSHIGRNIVVTDAGGLEKAEDGTAFTFPGATPTIVAATVHIREDKVYALSSDNRTFVTTTAGGYAMEERETAAGGTVSIRGAYRDGLIVDKVYYCTDDGLYETIDGFNTTGGMFQVLDAAAV